MAQPATGDNLDTNAPKALDDREGVWQSGVFRAYLSTTEANSKTANRRYLNMEVPIRIDVEGVPTDVIHRWNGTTWIVSDAIVLSGEASAGNLPTPSDETFIIL